MEECAPLLAAVLLGIIISLERAGPSTPPYTSSYNPHAPMRHPLDTWHTPLMHSLDAPHTPLMRPLDTP